MELKYCTDVNGKNIGTLVAKLKNEKIGNVK